LSGEVLTLSGPVQATGQLQLARSSYSIAVLIAHEGSWDPQLQEALVVIGPAGGRKVTICAWRASFQYPAPDAQVLICFQPGQGNPRR
jgi:hypothetical protein